MLGLAGCTWAAVPEGSGATPKPRATATPWDGATAGSATAQDDDWYFESRADDGTCTVFRFAGVTDADELGDSPRRVSEFIVPELTDGGPREFAQGEAILNDEGTVVAYIVASGDTPFSVAERFCSGQDEIALLNAVRRNTFYSTFYNDPDPPPASWITLYAGDTINLDPATITTVGDERGQVYSNTPNMHLPPQR